MKQLSDITLDDLTILADGLDDHDWETFANRVTKLNPVLGAVTAMHAEAADGNSPDVCDWPRHVLDDARQLAQAGIETVADARTWWVDRYAL